MKKLSLITALLIFGFAGLSNAAPAINQFITPSTSSAKGGVINNSGTNCNAQLNQSLVAVGTTSIKGIQIGSAGTAQCVAVSDLANCQLSTGAGQATAVFEACSAANTGNYFDFSNSPIKIVNGIVVTTSRTDGFAVVYTQQ